MKGQLVP